MISPLTLIMLLDTNKAVGGYAHTQILCVSSYHNNEYMVFDGLKYGKENKNTAVLAFPQNLVNFTECPRTGDTIFHGVTIMAEGTWTDSLNKKPLTYSAEEVSKMVFHRMSVKNMPEPFKAQHDIYGELPLTNEIGVIENAKLSLNPATWKADVRIYPTALGKDIATLIKRKQITDVSPEFFFEDILDGSKPTGIMFMGAATVRKGACRVCTFNEGIEGDIMAEDSTQAANPGIVAPETKTGMRADISALEAQLEQAKKLKGQDIEVLSGQLDEVKKAKENSLVAELESAKRKIAELEAQNKELITKIVEDDHTRRVKALEMQIAELSKTPVIHTTISASLSGRKAVAELGTGEFQNYSVRDFGSD